MHLRNDAQLFVEHMCKKKLFVTSHIWSYAHFVILCGTIPMNFKLNCIEIDSTTGNWIDKISVRDFFNVHFYDFKIFSMFFFIKMSIKTILIHLNLCIMLHNFTILLDDLKLCCYIFVAQKQFVRLFFRINKILASKFIISFRRSNFN